MKPVQRGFNVPLEQPGRLVEGGGLAQTQSLDPAGQTVMLEEDLGSAEEASNGQRRVTVTTQTGCLMTGSEETPLKSHTETV